MLNKNPAEQHMRRLVSLTSAAKKAGKRKRSEASCDEGKIPFL